MQPLTRLSDEEELFQSTVGQFARERLAPYVREMDESGMFRQELLDELFELGLDGGRYRRRISADEKRKFLPESILAIEGWQKVDPAAAVIVDVKNTLCNAAVQRWETMTRSAAFCRVSRGEHRSGSYALSEAGARARTPSR